MTLMTTEDGKTWFHRWFIWATPNSPHTYFYEMKENEYINIELDQSNLKQRTIYKWKLREINS